MTFRPGLYPIVGNDLELFAAVLSQWCVEHNRYACYVNIPKHGPPILCRPVDEAALLMLDEANLLPADLSARGRRFPVRRRNLELVP